MLDRRKAVRQEVLAGGVDKQLSTVENGGGRLIFTISVSQAANLMMSPVERSTMIRPGTCV